MDDADLEELLGPIVDRWTCRVCGRHAAVPSLARECELRCL